MKELQLGYNNIGFLGATLKCWIGMHASLGTSVDTILPSRWSANGDALIHVFKGPQTLQNSRLNPAACCVLWSLIAWCDVWGFMACGAWSRRRGERSAGRPSGAWDARMSSGTDGGMSSQSMHHQCLNKVKKIAEYNKMAIFCNFGTSHTKQYWYIGVENSWPLLRAMSTVLLFNGCSVTTDMGVWVNR